MSHSLFISDLHLCEHSPITTRLFHHFMQHSAPHAEALYVLGDLFEYWAGDDDVLTPFHVEITHALRSLTQHHVKLFIMHGNRDFLMAEKLARACNAQLLTDPTLLELYGQQTLLTHGDALCTDDIDYQTFRQQVRSNSWQTQFLAQPLSQRKAQIEAIRQHSKSEKQTKAENIMDVNLNAVHTLLREHHYPQIIHGHTHRPAHHLHHVDEHTCDRWVLGDWDTNANALRLDITGISWEKISGENN
jgi:UDP-2,3-diacylglucosamine hydrolase